MTLDKLQCDKLEVSAMTTTTATTTNGIMVMMTKGEDDHMALMAGRQRSRAGQRTRTGTACTSITICGKWLHWAVDWVA